MILEDLAELVLAGIAIVLIVLWCIVKIVSKSKRLKDRACNKDESSELEIGEDTEFSRYETLELEFDEKGKVKS